MAQPPPTIACDDVPLDEARRTSRGSLMNPEIWQRPQAEDPIAGHDRHPYCGAPSTQHVGFLWNGSRVALLDRADVCELNSAATGPTTNACTGNLRPGRYAFAKTPIGVDFHLLSVHFDSGTTNRDYTNRRQATQRIDEIAIGNAPILSLDQDVLVLGDFNTMGREEAPPVSAQQELSVFDGELAAGFRRLAMRPNCTEYFNRKAGALDHVVASTGMQEVAVSARVTGSGPTSR